MTLDKIIKSISQSQSTHDKGALFEILCLYFLKYDKFYKSKFSDLWLWKDWPDNHNKPDTGIDIIAKLRNSDSLCAIQCKFRDDSGNITKSEIDSFLSASSKNIFSERIIISTIELGNNALNALENQTQPVTCLTLYNLSQSSIDWDKFSFTDPDKVSYSHKELKPYQKSAVNSVLEGFMTHDRGRLIMACGTGKTFTSLKIAENSGKMILVLVPSISLLNQSVLAWHNDISDNINLLSFAVCSDSTAGRRDYPDEDMKFDDLALKPTTDSEQIINKWQEIQDSDSDSNALTVIFSTYQSLQVIHEAQEKGLPDFDLVICDEAHRTAGDKSSKFRLIHDDDYIHAHKRLYMTATPKIFTEQVKQKAADKNSTLCSMDDENIFGPEFFRLSFSEAVSNKLLSDYRVIIFMVDSASEDVNDYAKIIGIRKALAKELLPGDEAFIDDDPEPMKSAVVFTSTIENSKNFAKSFADTINESPDEFTSDIQCSVRHVDGTFPASLRNERLRWLNEHEDNSCRILSNARCLSEGVDVPALDAVIFLNPKKSEIDIVQSIGRVMRTAQGKKCGYVIIPIAVNSDMPPEEALDNNKDYKAVWDVLQALRSHDDKFEVIINSLELNGHDRKVIVRPPVKPGESRKDYELKLTAWEQAINPVIVRKCGDREYWPVWVDEIAKIAEDKSRTLNEIIKIPEAHNAFEEFLSSLKENINASITQPEALDMLSQHMISKPVFDELFSRFSQNNPVSKAIQKVLERLEKYDSHEESQRLGDFYNEVHKRVNAINDDKGRQNFIRMIYENFFAKTFKRTSEKLGIVYTPVEIVDFILHSSDWAVREKLGISEGLCSGSVHILDPFSGTGTFTARLIQSGLIDSELDTKYQHHISANEILLLAYYISAVNIESAFHSKRGTYAEFQGIVLTDTFTMNRDKTPPMSPVLYANGARAYTQELGQINVIIGNPPYSVGQKSANDNNQNQKYPELDAAIKRDYANTSSAVNKNSLYDSYIRAIKWASLRIQDNGIICFVTNESFIESNSADGMRKALAKEFRAIYIFNLRGNQRGDWRREGAKVFGEGSQCPVAITLFIKDSSHDNHQCEIFYYEVPDGLTQSQKLKCLAECHSFGSMAEAGLLTRIEPNVHGDWINQRGELFETFMNLGNKKDNLRMSIFGKCYSAGIKTGNDAYSYNFSREQVSRNITSLYPSAEISSETLRESLYNPYVKMIVHFERSTVQRVYQMPAIFPDSDTKNLAICIPGIGSKKYFSALMVDTMPSLTIQGASQCFPLYWYEYESAGLFGSGGLVRHEAINDSALSIFRTRYNDSSINKESIFYYIYGVLSSPEYAERFSNDAAKVLARVPFARDFRAFESAGRKLADLHVNYESVEKWPVNLVWTGERNYVIKKMKALNKSAIRYNDSLIIENIPESAWSYIVNGRSALDWIIERYQDSVDKASSIRNDCNSWGREHGDLSYVIDLIARVTRVSFESVKIFESMPELGV